MLYLKCIVNKCWISLSFVKNPKLKPIQPLVFFQVLKPKQYQPEKNQPKLVGLGWVGWVVTLNVHPRFYLVRIIVAVTIE